MIVGLITHSETAKLVMKWVESLANTDEEIEFLLVNPANDHKLESSVHNLIDEQKHTSYSITPITSPLPLIEIIEKCQQFKTRRLILSSFDLETESGQPQNSEELIKTSPFETILILSGSKFPSEIKRTLIMTSGGVHDLTALRLAEQIRERNQTSVCIGAVESQSGAHEIRTGKRFLKALLHDAALDHNRYEEKVVVERTRKRGILGCYGQQDLVIAGRDDLVDLQILQRSLQDSTILIVKRIPALSFRALPNWLPRIHPGDHADLLYDLRQGSRWNSDFISMLGLAAAIASLGLLQNSPAVVIGSMLLAPLMTPMIGAGLALAEAAPRMAFQCTKTIGNGVLLTLGVSFLIGLITPSRETLSPELLARGDPNVLDLLIAVFSAIAATIAIARPNISGAIAGVAIATALVPPLCSVGLSLEVGSFGDAVGAAILFIVNLIAIIISSSLTFSLLGVSRERALKRHQNLARLVRIAIIALLLILATPLTGRLLDQLHEGRSQTAVFPVTRAVSRALLERVDQDPGIEVTFMGRSSVTEAIVIHLASDHDIPESYADELRNIVRQEMDDRDISVIIVALDGQWVSRENFQFGEMSQP